MFYNNKMYRINAMVHRVARISCSRFV